MTRKTSFYFSFLALPPEGRKAITAVFDVCRAIDDAVDLESDPERADAALGHWRREVARIFSSDTPETPQGRALQPFARRFTLPRDQFDALCDGVAMDIRPRRYQTFADLEPYCHRVASSVGLMCAEIFGYQAPAVLVYARDLGVALQLTNILRDVGVDYRKGRLYLPLEDLAACGCTEADIAQAVARADAGDRAPLAPEVRAVLAHTAGRARQFFSRATAVLPAGDAASFVPAEIMRAVYWDLLLRIEAAEFQVFGELVRVPRPRQAMIAASTWWRLRGVRASPAPITPRPR